MSKRYQVWLGAKVVGDFRMAGTRNTTLPVASSNELHERVAAVIAGELAVTALRTGKHGADESITVTVDEE